MGFLPLPSMVLFFPFCPTPYDGENFFTPSLRLGTPPRPVKFYFILICHTIITILLIKHVSLKPAQSEVGRGGSRQGWVKLPSRDYYVQLPLIIERKFLFYFINLLKIKHYNKKNHF